MTFLYKNSSGVFLAKNGLTKRSNHCRLKSRNGLLTLDQRRKHMDELKLGVVEGKFADIIWENEPLSSGALVKLCEQKLEWKKSTTYTMLKRLCERGIFQNENGVVTALMSKEEFGAAQSEKIIEDNFDGSLPAFIAAFASRKKLSKKDVEEIQKMIDKMKED